MPETATTRPALTPPAALPALRLLRAPGSAPPYDDELPQPPVLRLVRPPALRPVPRSTPLGLAPDAATTRRAHGQLPDAQAFAQALVQRLLEVCGGVRPVTQLQADTTPVLYAALEKALQRRPRPTGTRPQARDVRSVHVQERPEGVAEVCATVRRFGRIGALAFRLEGHQGRWLCTQVQGV